MRNKNAYAISSAACSLAIFLTTGHAQASSHPLYVAVADDHGLPVRDLKASDFSIRIDGKQRSPISVESATGRMSIAVLVDGYTASNASVLQASMKAVIARIRQRLPQSRLSYSGVGATAAMGEPAFDLGRPLGSGSILERIIAAAGALRAEPNARRVILAISNRGLEIRLTPKTVVSALQDAHASLWNVDMSRVPVTSPDARVSPWTAEEGDQDKALDTAVNASGGARTSILDAAALEATANKMIDLWCAEYIVDPGPFPANAGKLQIEAVRHGLKTYSPTWAGRQ